MNKKIIVCLLMLAVFFSFPLSLSPAQEGLSLPESHQEAFSASADLESMTAGRSFRRLLFFFSKTCHACHKTKNEVIPLIEKEFLDKVIVEYLDIEDVNSYKLMLALKQKYQCADGGVPAVFIDGTVLVGFDKIKAGLRDAVVEALKRRRAAQDMEKLPGIDLVKHFLSFGIITIAFAGLVDGINPCAFTVIVFFISFLALQGYRKRELLVIGISFIGAVFATYVLIGLGIFRFLYALNQFYVVSRAVYYAIALFCFVLGGVALYDFWLFRKTKKTEGLILQLPGVIKNRIHAVIGKYYRKPKGEHAAEASGRGYFLGLLASALVTGFLVSLLEAVCTGQLYLPTITFMLKESFLRRRAFAYLLLYNLMFIMPLVAVLVFGLLGVTSEGFSAFIKRHMEAVKLLLAGLFFVFGLFILLAA